MRQIKFRAWDGKKMLENPRFEFFNHGKHGSAVMMANESEAVEIMQFTGLTDKNGKDVFEGDIIEGHYRTYDPCADEWREAEKMCGEVFYDFSGYRMKVIQHRSDPDRDGMVNYFDFTDHQRYAAEFDDFAVIGNIYENPELLNPKNV